jgi:hypothetical protein
MKRDQQLSGRILQLQVKSIKKQVPSSCTFLAPYTDKSGEVYLKAVINKKPTYLSIPQDFQFTVSDVNRIIELITNKCHVSEGNENDL